MTRRLERCSQALGYTFRNMALLRQALTHSSYGSPHNERLEFLGDAVLNTSLGWLLYQQFPHATEAQLTRMRARCVRGATLQTMGLACRLDRYVRVGPSVDRLCASQHWVADAFEAVVGAVLLDSDFDTVMAWLATWYAEQLAALDPNQSLKDPKTLLQEWLQARREALPVYRMIADHPVFRVACEVGSQATQGTGPSRRDAEQTAARAMLARLDPALKVPEHA